MVVLLCGSKVLWQKICTEYNRRTVVVKQFMVATWPDDPLPASAINVRSGLTYRQIGLCGSLLTHEADSSGTCSYFEFSAVLD